MTTSSQRTRAARSVAALAAATSLGSLVISTSQPAGADPRPVLIGVGSDTTQDVINGLAGDALQPTLPALAGTTKIRSFDAIVGGAIGSCITAKVGTPTFDRPNGSSNGRRALSRAIDGTPWTVTGSTCPSAAGVNVSGVIDFARSSAGPASGSGAGPLMYLPLGRDALSFGYASVGVATPVTSLTSAQLTSLFTTGPQTINGVNIIPCSIQTGSGTYQSWNTTVGVTAAQMASATTTCRTAPGVVAPGEIQENDGNGLRTRADSFVGSQVIIGYSAANFIAQSNGVAVSQLPPGGGVDLGEVVVPTGNLGKPYTGSGTSLAPNPTFYANTTFGRTVYNVVQATKITGAGNNQLKQMFAQTAAFGTPAVCAPAAQAIVNSFGFSSLPGSGAGTCGDQSLTGPLLTGNGTR